MINISGEFTINSDGYNAVDNSFTIQHDTPNIVAAPYSVTITNADGHFEEFEPKAVEFCDSYIKIYFGSFVINDTDVISYQFSIIYGEGE